MKKQSVPPLGSTSTNLFYDILPTDLQDYIVKIPIVEQIIHNQRELAKYELLESIRTTHFIQLNQMHRTRSAPYKPQMLLNHWCLIMQKPLSAAHKHVPVMFDDLIVLMNNQNNDSQQIQASKINQMLEALSDTQEAWFDNCYKYLNELYNATNSKLDLITQNPTRVPMDDPSKMYFITLSDLNATLNEQNQLINLYHGFETVPSDSTCAQIFENCRDVLLFHGVMVAMMSDFIIQRKCIQCEMSTTSQRGYCPKCVHMAPPKVNLFKV